MVTLAHGPPVSTNIWKSSSCGSKWDALSIICHPTVNPRPALTSWRLHCSQKLLSSVGLNIRAVENGLMVIFVKYVITVIPTGYPTPRPLCYTLFPGIMLPQASDIWWWQLKLKHVGFQEDNIHPTETITRFCNVN